MTIVLFLGGLLLCVILQAVSVLALRALRRESRAKIGSAFSPPVSIVKPLSGLDAALEENLESFFRLDYPEFEIVFSFASETDPAFAVARRVADRHPGVPAWFVVDPREPGRNAKVNRLAAGLRRARGAYFLLSDGDVRVTPDFLSRAVSWFREPSVGLVSHLFRTTGASSLGARLESLYLDGVLRAATAAIARILRMPCVVGKSILVSRAALNAIGGLLPVRDYLAEDFLLGKLVEGAGFRVVLSGDEIETFSGPKSLAAVWQRHRRWAILRRRLGGACYASEALASPALFAAGAVVASGGSRSVLVAVVLLWATRLAIESYARRGAGPALTGRDLLLLPFHDLAVALLFWAGLVGSRTRWRGRRLRVGPGTLLIADGKDENRAPNPNKIRRKAA